ncbi:MAG: TonB-dependent receptor [Candidatus Aminicenantes bacterium]|nr:TonB-dependent receptor [Candidatus Aminicenantes bacterium]
MIKKILKLSLIFLLALGLDSTAFPQGRQTGSISGSVLDNESIPLPGATVTLSGPAMMGSVSYVISEVGKFRFVALSPGEYDVKVELPGFKTYIKKGLRVSVGKTTEVDIILEPTPVKEEVTVVAVSPVVDIQSSKMSVHYGSDFLMSLPSSRDLSGISLSLPGTVEAESGREYTRMTSVLGGHLRSTLYQIDGAVLNDPTTMYIAANVNVDVFEEVEITLGALPAETGMSDTAVVNIVSKSGGNKFSGVVSGYYTGTGDLRSFKFLPSLAQELWTEEQMKALNVVPPQKYSDYLDGSVSFGGPIIEDRIWFFLNGRYVSWEQVNPATPHVRIQKIYDTNPSAFDSRELEHYDLSQEDWLAFAKLTFQLTKNIRYMGMLHFNMVNQPIYTLRTGDTRAWGYTALVDHEKVYTTSHHLNWVLDQNTFVEIIGNYVNRYFPNLMRRETANNYTTYDKEANVYWGNTIYSDDYYRKRGGVSGYITRFQDDFLGASHEFKAGAEYEATYYIRDRCRGYEQGDNPYWTYWYDFSTQDKYYYSPKNREGRLRMYPFAHLGVMTGEDNTKRYSAFTQDSIVAGRLAINIGLRFDHSYAYEPEAFRPELLNYKVGPEFLNPAITDPNALLIALNDQYHHDPNVEYNQVSALDAFTFPYKKVVQFSTFSPRIGLVYDLFGNGKTALKLSFARYYEPLWSGKYNSPQMISKGTLNWYWTDVNKNGYMDLPRTGPADPKYIDPNGDLYRLTDYVNQDPSIKYYADDIKCPYMNEFIAGIEHEVMENFRLGLQFIYKQNKDITEDIDPNNGYDANTTDDQGRPIWLPYDFVDPGWDGKFGTDDDKQMTVYGLADYAPTPYFLGSNPSGCEREYIAGVFTFEKRMSNRWQLNGSIIYSAFKGNANHDYGGAEGETTLYDNPNSLINAYGRIRYDRPLNIKILGSYILPLDIVVSAYFNYRSGLPWARTLDRVYFPKGFGAQTSYVSILAEPSGTQRNAPETLLDVRLEKSFNFGTRGKLSFYVDVFNLGGSTSIATVQNPNARLWYYETPSKYTLASTYGDITGISGVRSVRLGFRLSF